MYELTPRQIELLKIIIEEYIETAQPIGSEMLDRKYNLGVSPATIRNEMVQLVRSGHLTQPHVSAGRIPSPKALRFYISEIMREDDLSVAEEVSVKERIWDVRQELDDLLRESTRTLADKTKCVGIAVTNDHKTYHSGYLHLLDEPEFYDIDVTKSVFSLLEEGHQLVAILERASGEDAIHVLLGDDFSNRHLHSVSIVFSDFHLGPVAGSIGVIGPSRLRFSYVIPVVRHLTRTLQDITQGQF